jgi:hypothetical protein
MPIDNSLVWDEAGQIWLYNPTRRPDTEEDEPHDECECEGCRLKKGYPSKIKNRRVQRYNAKPVGGWQPRAMLGDKYKYMLGVELETDNNNSSYSRMNDYFVSNTTASGMGKPRGFWLPKHDGSVSGPEFASHPATLTWWEAHRRDMGDMFKMLVHAGFRSHDGGHAGMHVNIGKVAFDGNEKHLARFIKLVNINPQWSRIMAQRTINQESQWAHLNTDLAYDETMMQQLCQAILSDSWATNKYTALNAPRGEQRIEFRLPRGTLRVDRFYKNLQWTQAMIEYTRTLRSMNTAVPDRFMKWVEGKMNGVYPDLSSFMGEKRTALLNAGRSY